MPPLNFATNAAQYSAPIRESPTKSNENSGQKAPFGRKASRSPLSQKNMNVLLDEEKDEKPKTNWEQKNFERLEALKAKKAQEIQQMENMYNIQLC